LSANELAVNLSPKSRRVLRTASTVRAPLRSAIRNRDAVRDVVRYTAVFKLAVLNGRTAARVRTATVLTPLLDRAAPAVRAELPAIELPALCATLLRAADVICAAPERVRLRTPAIRQISFKVLQVDS
jgi:hypothetical protein